MTAPTFTVKYGNKVEYSQNKYATKVKTHKIRFYS